MFELLAFPMRSCYCASFLLALSFGFLPGIPASASPETGEHLQIYWRLLPFSTSRSLLHISLFLHFLFHVCLVHGHSQAPNLARVPCRRTFLAFHFSGQHLSSLTESSSFELPFSNSLKRASLKQFGHSTFTLGAFTARGLNVFLIGLPEEFIASPLPRGLSHLRFDRATPCFLMAVYFRSALLFLHFPARM